VPQVDNVVADAEVKVRTVRTDLALFPLLDRLSLQTCPHRLVSGPRGQR
jgi:hypothetical protein